MAKIQKSGVIRLDEKAISSMSVMLTELLTEDKHLKINHSKLASFILVEFHSKHYEKARLRLLLAHQDKRKQLLNAIGVLSAEELEATIKYLGKLKKPTEIEP